MTRFPGVGPATKTFDGPHRETTFLIGSHSLATTSIGRLLSHFSLNICSSSTFRHDTLATVGMSDITSSADPLQFLVDLLKSVTGTSTDGPDTQLSDTTKAKSLAEFLDALQKKDEESKNNTGSVRKNVIVDPRDVDNLRMNGCKCPFCPKVLTDEKTMRCHINTHLVYDKRPYRCETCGRAYCYPEHLARHIKLKH